MTENQEANNQEANNQEAKNRQWLNNYVGRHRLGKLTYDDDDQLIPGNKHIWTSTVQLGGTNYGHGQAGTKWEAREQAAEEALEALKAEFGFGPEDEHHD